MGDRANVFVKGCAEASKEGVYLYTHWGGSNLHRTVKTALLRGSERHNDNQYLARIVFCEMVDDLKGTTGFGISSCLHDNEHNIIILDCKGKTVAFASEKNINQPFVCWSMEEFVNLSDTEVSKYYFAEQG